MVDYDLGKVRGADGRGIVSIEKTGASGLIDTYTITYSDGTTTTFVVKNGEDGSAITIDTALSSSSTNPVQNKVIKTALDNKSDSSHNHDSRYYTETEMDTKLGGKANTSHTHNISDVSNLQSSLDGKSDTGHTHTKSNITDFAHTHDDRYYTETETDNLLSGKASSSHSHSKSDITDFPTIPSKTSDLTNDSGFLTSHQDISGKEDKSNKVSNWSSTVNNTRYPTEKLVKDSLDGKASSSHTHLTSSTDILTEESYPNIGVSSGDKLITVFNGIDTKIGDLEDLIGDAITYINGSGS